MEKAGVFQPSALTNIFMSVPPAALFVSHPANEVLLGLSGMCTREYRQIQHTPARCVVSDAIFVCFSHQRVTVEVRANSWWIQVVNLELRIMGIEQPDHMKSKQHCATCVFTSVSTF